MDNIISDPTPITEPLLTANEVARLFRVEKKTVARWARAGLLRSLRTPGGRHRRYRRSDVQALLLAEEAC